MSKERNPYRSDTDTYTDIITTDTDTDASNTDTNTKSTHCASTTTFVVLV